VYPSGTNQGHRFFAKASILQFKISLPLYRHKQIERGIDRIVPVMRELIWIGETNMDRTDCLRDKLSSRTVGFILLGFSLLIAFAGFLIVPVLGVFFALPLLILAGVFIAAPESKVCRLITGKRGA
jgi:hypothetical protein